MRYYMGLDNGGTTTKAAILDGEGHEIGVASVETASISLRPDFVERDMEEMWEANCTVAKQVLAKTGIDPKDIAAVSVCGHGKGLYLWGKDDKPARNGIISTDNRAYAYSTKWAEDGTEMKAYKYSVQHLMPCQPVCLLAWLRDNEPESYKNIRWVFSCKDYVKFRLTGTAMAEYSDNSGSNIMNLYTEKFDKDLLDVFGLGDLIDCFPPLKHAAEVCGTVSEEAAARCGLLPGTPVVGGMFDIDACCLAVGVLNDKNVCMIAGTWSINEYPSSHLITDGTAMMNSLFAIPGKYLVEECSATSAANNEWFAKNLLPELAAESKKTGKKVYKLMDEWVEEIGPYEFCPVFLPFLLASNVHPNAKASFVGIAGNHTRKHLCRSVFEGIVFSHKYHYDRLLKTRQDKPDCIRLAGGVTNSEVWVQMFADILETPVEIVDVKETGALGCAIASAVAVGQYPTIEEAAAKMVRVTKRIEPNAERFEIYRKKYALYLKTIDALDSLWGDMQALIEESK